MTAPVTTTSPSPPVSDTSASPKEVMPANTFIVLIIVVGVVFIALLLRARITRIYARMVGGEVGMDAAPPESEQASRLPSTSVSGNKLLGKKQRLRVTRDHVNVNKNLIKGEEQQLDVDVPSAQSSDSDNSQQP